MPQGTSPTSTSSSAGSASPGATPLPTSTTTMEDFLGSSRVITTATGTVCYDADFYPFGGERAYTNTCPQNYKFEGKERDTETGNDHFGARYYSPSQGRWLSADWSAVPAPIPYANLANPQTLNLYAMVHDNPETFADLDGHDEVVRAGPNDANGLGGGGDVSDLQPDTVLERQQQNQQPQSQQAQNQTNQQTRADIAATAQKYSDEASTAWAFAAQKGAFACNTNKCNAFVGDVTKEAGAPVSVTGSDGKPRYPLASELADKNRNIANWRVLGPGEKPQPGDVAAYKLSGGGTSFSGHSGIVTSVDRNGVVHAVAAHERVVGPDNKFQPGSTEHTVVFRRYTGDQ